MTEKTTTHIPFVVTTDKGGTLEPLAYAAGFEMGVLMMALGDQIPPRTYEQSLMIQNVKQADLIAMYHGYRVRTRGNSDGQRVTLVFTKTAHSLDIDSDHYAPPPVVEGHDIPDEDL